MLSPRAQRSLNQVEKTSDRIINATFHGNPKASVICCYSPTDCSDEQDEIIFYNELSSLIRMIPNHNIIMVAGDFNAKLGSDDGFTQSFHCKSNRNGILLTELMNDHKLVCLNTKFQKKSGKKWTFQNPNGAKEKLDFILINRKWSNGATNCEVCNTFSSVGSDHRIVSAQVHLSLRANKIKSTKPVKFDWSSLKEKSVSDKLKIELRNRLSILQLENTEDNNNISYKKFETAYHEAAETCIP